jgi:hypothetical protein
VDSVPDPQLLRKSGSDGNQTRDLWDSSQELNLKAETYDVPTGLLNKALYNDDLRGS